MRRTWLWWSTGKDSAWALHVLESSTEFEITALVTTVTPRFGRVAIHGTRMAILEAQAAAAGLPLRTIELPYPCTNQQYEAAVVPTLAAARRAGVEAMAFGDLFLEDVREYRERLLEGSGVRPTFPIWARDTAELAREMIDGGVDARITCLDPQRVPRDLAGRRLDHDLLDRLPADVDPCGEGGEFHTCVLEGPMLKQAIPAVSGEVVEREGFVYADLVPGEAAAERPGRLDASRDGAWGRG
ncbi:MAG: ATP-binding protein [Gemmatimonadota bacterium]